MWGYRQRLERDLARWQAQGLVTADAAARILAETRSARTGPTLAGVLGTLAAILMGFAAMSFVAANWQEMPKWVRLILIAATITGSHGLAFVLFQRGREAFGHAATLAGTLIFGAAIMLVSQMYHADGHPPDLLLIWGIAALATGCLVRSPPSLAAAMALFAGWSGWETGLTQAIHWTFLPAWAATTAAFLALRWRPGVHVAALAVSLWLVGLGYVIDDPRGQLIVAVIGVTIAAASALATRQPGLGASIGPVAFSYGVAIAYAGFFAHQFVHPFIEAIGSSGPRPGPDVLVARALPVLAFLTVASLWAMARGGRAAVAVSVAALTVELVALLLTGDAHWLVAASGATVAALALTGQRQLGWSVPTVRSSVVYGSGMAFFALYAWQFWSDRPASAGPRTFELVVLAVLALGLVIALIAWSTRHALLRVQWAAFAAFSVEVFSLYANTIGTLLGTSLFLLVASVIVGALAWFAIRLHERTRDGARSEALP